MIQLNKVIRAINTIHFLGIFVLLLVNNNLYKIELLRQNICKKDNHYFSKRLSKSSQILTNRSNK